MTSVPVCQGYHMPSGLHYSWEQRGWSDTIVHSNKSHHPGHPASHDIIIGNPQVNTADHRHSHRHHCPPPYAEPQVGDEQALTTFAEPAPLDRINVNWSSGEIATSRLDSSHESPAQQRPRPLRGPRTGGVQQQPQCTNYVHLHTHCTLKGLREPCCIIE
jgi:hypothetical protein